MPLENCWENALQWFSKLESCLSNNSLKYGRRRYTCKDTHKVIALVVSGSYR